MYMDPLTILLIGAANWQHHLIGATESQAPFLSARGSTASLLPYSSFNWCCKDLQPLLKLAEIFYFILAVSGGKTFLAESKIESLYY
jgi:hypothetical protein